MPTSIKRLKNLRIAEVSSVDRAANAGARVMLAKHDDAADPLEVVDKAFADSVADIIADTESSAADKVNAFIDEFADYLDETADDEPTTKLLEDVLADMDDDESAVVGRDRPPTGSATARVRRRRRDRALAEQRAGAISGRLSPFARKDATITMEKDMDILQIAKMVSEGSDPGQLTKREFYDEIVKRARETRLDGETAEQCFTRFVTRDAVGRQLFAAHRAAPGADCFDEPVTAKRGAPPAGPALMQLNSLATQHRAAHPKLSQAQAFSHVYQAPENRGLVAQHKQEARAAAMA
jgi:hypothetical protein